MAYRLKYVYDLLYLDSWADVCIKDVYGTNNRAWSTTRKMEVILDQIHFLIVVHELLV